jgi:hypothetical protein
VSVLISAERENPVSVLISAEKTRTDTGFLFLGLLDPWVSENQV